MSEIAVRTPVAPAELDQQPQLAEREIWLHEMLGTDYEHAQELGLVEQFAYNPETDTDALRHLLSGDVKTLPDGTVLAAGFHHEPSAGEGTYVDRSHLQQGMNSRKRKDYAERPFEPYLAQAVVGGRKKNKLVFNENGEVETMPAVSNMFPKEYDPLTIMKTVVGARNSRDRSKDRIVDSGNIRVDGSWVMLDDKTLMRMTLILDPATEKIISAMPIVRNYMNLNPVAVAVHLGLQTEEPKDLQ